MSFGWSAGDILAAGKFILDVASALDDVKGAAKDFRDASSFLKNLNAALTPLEAFTALDSRTEYKADIEREVKAIKTPIEKFINDVKETQKKLGVPKEGHFRHLQNIPSKLKWHFFTSKKALALQQEVGHHLTIIDSLMSRLTVDMIHSLPADIKSGFDSTLDEKLSVHSSAFQAILFKELAERDYAMKTAWQEELLNLFERSLGSQRVVLTSPPGTKSMDLELTPEKIKDNAAHLKSRYQAKLLEGSDYPLVGVTADSDVTFKIQNWWAENESGILWVQTPPKTSAEFSLASDMIALSRAANFPIAAYFCQRLDAEGYEFSQSGVLIDLIYSLIYQLSVSISENGPNDIDLGASRFAELDGTTRSLPQAFDMFLDLVSVGSARRFLIIDGIEVLDYSNDSVLEGYLKILFQHLRNTDTSNVVKTLITTEGHSRMVLDEIGWENTVDASFSCSLDGFFSLSDFEEGFR